MVQSVTLVLAFIFVLVSLMVDILYAVLDPRLRRFLMRDRRCEPDGGVPMT